MNKNQGILIGIACVLLFTAIALATSTASSDVEIYAFDQNPAGSDKGNEWVTLFNPLNESVDIGNWILETADSERETILEGTTLYPFAYYVYTSPYQWLDNSEEAITLSDSKSEEVARMPKSKGSFSKETILLFFLLAQVFFFSKKEKVSQHPYYFIHNIRQ